jgi:hypothetical protein
MWTDLGNVSSALKYMNVEIGTEDAQFLEKEYRAILRKGIHK